jgi:multiple sugar transport system permease protein
MSRPHLLLPLVMLAPSLGLVLWIIGYPVVDLMRMSVHAVNRFGQVGHFVGSLNFSGLLGDPLFWASFRRTILWTVCVTAGTVLISLPTALILSQDFAGRSLARLIVLLPWAVSATMTGIVWRWTLNGQFGMLNALLMELGLIGQPVEFLATGEVALPVAILIGILAAIPLTVIIFLGAFSSLPNDVFDAALIDGAGPLARFRYMTLPLIRPFIDIAVVLNVIYAFNSFGIVWILTQGGPANSTDILVTYLYKVAFQYGKLAEASAMSLMMFAFLLACCALYARFALRERAW